MVNAWRPKIVRFDAIMGAKSNTIRPELRLCGCVLT